jgi:hypothetical protein
MVPVSASTSPNNSDVRWGTQWMAGQSYAIEAVDVLARGLDATTNESSRKIGLPACKLHRAVTHRADRRIPYKSKMPARSITQQFNLGVNFASSEKVLGKQHAILNEP